MGREQNFNQAAFDDLSAVLHDCLSRISALQ